MYKQLQTKIVALLALLLMGAGSAWADTSTVTASKIESASATWTGTAGVSWNVVVDGGATNQNITNSYAQVGTKASPSTSITFSTSGISGTITSIVVNCASYSGKATISATVGGSAFGTQNQSTPSWSSNSGGDVTFSGSASGTIVITMNNPSDGRAMYIKSITVTYSGSGETPTVAVPVFSPAAGAVAYGTSVSLVQADAFLINYTTDGSDPTWDNGKDIDSNPITITRDITIKARAYDRDQNASSIVTAEYTVLRPDAPTFSPAAGAVEEGTTVTISGRPTGGKIIYTTDGTNPSYSGNIGTVYVDGDVITINQAMTIKAIAVDAHDFESSVASASYTIYDPNAPGTQNNPYTVAQALDASASTGVYVRGIISRIYSTSVTNNGQIRYYISDDGTTENEMNIYNGKGLNGADFISIDDIQVGDVVVIFGDISVYQNANQMAANNYIVSLQRKQVTSIALSGTYPTTFVEGSTFSHEGIVVTATYDDNSTVDVTERATFSEPNMTQVGEQTVTVTYLDKTATYTINITALPTHTATFSIEGITSTQDFKEGAAIVFPNVSNRNGFTFVGWVTSTINGTQSTAPEMVTNATMGTADVTYYAVFAKGSSSSEPASATISYATEGVPTSYGDAKEYTLTGIKFMIQQMYKNGEKLQWRANGNSNGTGTMYNVDPINKIQSIVLTYDSGDNNKNFTVNVGNEQNPTSGTSITPTSNENVYTFDCSANNVNYFVLANGTNAGYLTSIVINYLHETSNYADYCTTIPVPSITVADADISVTAEGDVDTRAITYEYIDITDATDFAVYFYDSEGNELREQAEPDWIEVEVASENDSYMISYLVDPNTGAERTAYFKVAALSGDDFIFSNLVTVTQAACPSATATIAEACTDGTKYYGTYSNTRAFILPEGVTASEISVIDGELYVEDYAAGAVVPANTGVMISSATAGEKTFYLTTGGESVLGEDNMLRATGDGITADAMAEEDPACLYYRLTMHNGETIGFWWGAEDGAAFSVAANKAYLAVPANQAKDGFAFGNDGGATEIVLNALKGEQNGEMYNLQGQKVGSEYKGIVIVNGKKFINK